MDRHIRPAILHAWIVVFDLQYLIIHSGSHADGVSALSWDVTRVLQ
jgi:hypothetical protein